VSRKGIPGQRMSLSRDWEWAIEDYLHTLAAAGQRDATRKLRDNQLRNMARCLGCPPEDVTAEVLVDWFGQQTWNAEHRRSNQSAVKGFFSWAYKAGRVPVYLGDVLPRLSQPKAAPRPAPDYAWTAALAAADARTTLMLRLAAEIGLRRAEVAQVHSRDAFITGGTAQLVVAGKGGKKRIIPISDALAELIRRGAAFTMSRGSVSRAARGRTPPRARSPNRLSRATLPGASKTHRRTASCCATRAATSPNTWKSMPSGRESPATCQEPR
jgi:integrase